MSKVVYRGAQYDTEELRKAKFETMQEQWREEIYRGIKYVRHYEPSKQVK